MTDKKWFILTDGLVSGPFERQEVELKTLGMTNSLIWGRGQTEWTNAERWQRHLKESDNPENTRIISERLWNVKNSGIEMKPMTHDQMIDYLKEQKDLGEIQIWTEGYSDWKDVYQIHKIMDELGVSRRQHPRVPIMGTLTCEGTTGNFNARVLSISEGGLGATEAPGVKIGEKFKTTLKSPNLYSPIHSTAEIVYVGEDGYAGFKFINLHSESKSAIIEYVKKFTDLKAQT